MINADTPAGTPVVRRTDGCTGTLVSVDPIASDGGPLARVNMDATATHEEAEVLGNLTAWDLVEYTGSEVLEWMLDSHSEMPEHEVILTDGDATLADEWCLTCDAAATAECKGETAPEHTHTVDCPVTTVQRKDGPWNVTDVVFDCAPKVDLTKRVNVRMETPRERFVRSVGELHDAINAACQAEFECGQDYTAETRKAVSDARATMWRMAYDLYDFGPQEEA